MSKSRENGQTLFYLGYSEFLAQISLILTLWWPWDDLFNPLQFCNYCLTSSPCTCLRYHCCEGRCKLRITFPGCGILSKHVIWSDLFPKPCFYYSDMDGGNGWCSWLKKGIHSILSVMCNYYSLEKTLTSVFMQTCNLVHLFAADFRSGRQSLVLLSNASPSSKILGLTALTNRSLAICCHNVVNTDSKRSTMTKKSFRNRPNTIGILENAPRWVWLQTVGNHCLHICQIGLDI